MADMQDYLDDSFAEIEIEAVPDFDDGVEIFLATMAKEL